ncbi:MAG: hypothetical protein HRU39_18455 [Salinicola sp.]|uniref:hypothetical protein n=1 Tax=Salinicola sp. TaxID=1978524 RepID=UPI001E0AF212|nr:hypothetical protein [Salinicola sp.]NRB57937.1 hypothetical protein [Salinicola sp.]
MFFKHPSSNHPLQQRFNAQKKSKNIFNALLLLAIAIPLLIMGVFFFPPAAFSLIELLADKPIVNINYVALFLLGGVPASYTAGLLGWSTLFYRRVLIPSEMKPFFAQTLKWSVALMIISIGIGGVLSILTAPLIWLGGYSYCSEMTEGSAWNSYWVQDINMCAGEH